MPLVISVRPAHLTGVGAMDHIERNRAKAQKLATEVLLQATRFYRLIVIKLTESHPGVMLESMGTDGWSAMGRREIGLPNDRRMGQFSRGPGWMIMATTPWRLVFDHRRHAA